MVAEQAVTVETLKEIAEAFNRHDLEAIMEFCAEDCVLWKCPEGLIHGVNDT